MPLGLRKVSIRAAYEHFFFLVITRCRMSLGIRLRPCNVGIQKYQEASPPVGLQQSKFVVVSFVLIEALPCLSRQRSFRCGHKRVVRVPNTMHLQERNPCLTLIDLALIDLKLIDPTSLEIRLLHEPPTDG